MVSSVRRFARFTALCSMGMLGCAGTPEPAKTAPAGGDPGAAWVASAVARIRVDTGDAGGMRGCKGTLTPEARAYFAKVYAEAWKCAAAAAPPVKGSLTLHSTLEEGGGQSEFSVLEDKLGAAQVVKCIQEKSFSFDFPKVDPKTPCVQLVHPMTFP